MLPFSYTLTNDSLTVTTLDESHYTEDVRIMRRFAFEVITDDGSITLFIDEYKEFFTSNPL